MSIDEAAVVEDLLDALMMGDLAQSRTSVSVTRLAPGSVRVDYGEPGEVFILEVERDAST